MWKPDWTCWHVPRPRIFLSLGRLKVEALVSSESDSRFRSSTGTHWYFCRTSCSFPCWGPAFSFAVLSTFFFMKFAALLVTVPEYILTNFQYQSLQIGLCLYLSTSGKYSHHGYFQSHPTSPDGLSRHGRSKQPYHQDAILAH